MDYPCRAESPSQVWVIVLVWLMEVLQKIPPEKWSEVVISYDNMCKLDVMKAARVPLPLPEPYDAMWSSVTKVSTLNARINTSLPKCRLSTSCTLWITLIQGARSSAILAKERRSTQEENLCVLSRPSPGSQNSEEFCMQCPKHTTCFTSID